MATQFLDSRLSLNNIYNTGTAILPATPTLLGDIGLQTVGAIGTPNQSDVRVELWGTIGISGTAADTVNIFVERGGTGVFGTGVLIFAAVIPLTSGPGSRLETFVAGDFPPVSNVVTGQIRYTMYASNTGETDVTITGPVSFTGLAQAGTS
ncbi:MAG TPA: hypothetical protein DEF35_08895 [Paenibacillus sp.]|uniref:hypothetical protein n=1 Tax=Paenibacillus TaxID=44249 RepID=UPI000B9FE450|nr:MULTISPECIES: hypothetical protein [Paenibacillus]OZQ64350.1 hypothetical protein CA599_22565 [Paenibacillus taichungensis]HBU81742.1 hypothetical protein [Paenibacillus sp.]